MTEFLLLIRYYGCVLYHGRFSWIVTAVVILSMITISSGLCSRKGSGQTKKQAAVTTTSAVPGATPLPGAGYKPGHLPVFIDTDEKAADTFYELKTKHLFPNKGEIVPKSVTGSKVGGGGGPAPAIDGPAESAVQQQPNAPKSKSPR